MSDHDFHPEFFSYGEAPEIVFGTNDPGEALTVKGLLESAGLYVEMHPSAGSYAVTAHRAYIELTVPAGQAAEARALLDEFEDGIPEFDEGEDRDETTR